MLKVTLHYATPGRVNASNVLGRLDIGYARLDARADYKALLFLTGVGELPPIRLENYPRWSASVWDLVARIVCLGFNLGEFIEPLDTSQKRTGAFIEDMTAVIEHWPDGLDTRRRTIGTAHIHMRKSKCLYKAIFEDDLTGRRESTVFKHAPEGLNPWDLLVRAYAWTVTETFELPPRPALYVPIPVENEGASVVPIETVSEPARTGLQRWLHKQGLPTSATELVLGPCVPEERFVEFLRKAV